MGYNDESIWYKTKVITLKYNDIRERKMRWEKSIKEFLKGRCKCNQKKLNTSYKKHKVTQINQWTENSLNYSKHLTESKQNTNWSKHFVAHYK